MKTMNTLNKDISLNTKLNVLFTALVLLLSYLFNVNEMGMVVVSLMVLAGVLLVDYYMVVSSRYPRAWRVTKWMIFLTIIMITLISFFEN